MSESQSGKMFGAVTVGERGQIVIPSDIRKSFQIKPGDKLIVFAQANAIRLIRSETFTKFLAEASEVMEKIQK
ncbi:MAG: AbrB/MazE/SpoVT family DNA-binding domain-containing protein [Candidatus Omnitrophica bacterium]|nr:AbrB/MazE/SpoVT family DNA-binding domain-containing protein [Candidatus Omnitrophota bacterium]